MYLCMHKRKRTADETFVHGNIFSIIHLFYEVTLFHLFIHFDFYILNILT